jgi:hypothetical protein
MTLEATGQKQHVRPSVCLPNEGWKEPAGQATPSHPNGFGPIPSKLRPSHSWRGTMPVKLRAARTDSRTIRCKCE